jgi:RNA polymerase sigma-70 factor (ECF subfamily)
MAGAADRKVFEAELIALIPHLRAFGRSLCGDVAGGEDLAQEALARAWSSREVFQMGTNMKAWTFMILRNLFYSDKRRAWRSTPLDSEVAERTLVAVTGDTDRLELDELRRALAMLSCDQREALVLIGAAGLSYEEAAAVMQCPPGTVKSRVSRARDQLALIYAEGGIAKDGVLPEAAMDAILSQMAQYRRAA